MKLQSILTGSIMLALEAEAASGNPDNQLFAQLVIDRLKKN
jgi:hypothetical protein